MGICHWRGYGFQAVWSGKVFGFQAIWSGIGSSNRENWFHIMDSLQKKSRTNEHFWFGIGSQNLV